MLDSGKEEGSSGQSWGACNPFLPSFIRQMGAKALERANLRSRHLGFMDKQQERTSAHVEFAGRGREACRREAVNGERRE